MAFSYQRKISSDLVLSLICSVITVLILVTIVNYIMISNNEKRIFGEKTNEYIEYLQQSLVQPIWSYDDISIRYICTSILKNDAIVKLKVTNPLGEKLYEGHKPGYTELTARTGLVTREGELLGSIEMALTPRPYQEMTRYLFWASILTILSALVVVVCVTHIILKSFLGRPLQYLHARIDRIANGDYGYDPKTYKQMEIESILSKFNEMAMKIEARENSLADLNVRLKAEILERERSEQELRASEERFRTYFEHSLLPMAITLPDKSWDKINDRLIDLLGYSREELRTMTWAELTHPEDLEPDFRQFRRMLAGEIKDYPLEKRFIRKDGEVVDTILSVALVRKTDGSPDYVLAQLQDITERKQMERALRRTQFSVDHARDAVYWIGPDAELLYVNKAACQALGYSREELLSMTVFDIDPTFPRETWREHWSKTLWMDSYLIETKHQTKDGRVFPVEIAIRVMPYEGIAYHSCFARDISERQRAEEESRQLRNYLSNVINSMPSVLVGVDCAGRVTQWNKATEKMTGIRSVQARGQPLDAVLPVLAQELPTVHQAIRDREIRLQPKVPRLVDGEIRYQDVTVYPLVGKGVEGAVIRVDDVTDRVRIEEMMIQSEKMLSVGGLAAGMAHEINNPLGAILQASQNILRRVSPGLPANARVAEECGTTLSAVRNYLEQREILLFLEDVRNSGLRAAQIVENMLAFSRKPDAKGSSTNVAELLDRTLLLAESDYDLKKRHDFRQIGIVREYAPGAPLVVCQPSKIQQVFLNILRNGAEAMGENRDLGHSPRFVLRVLPEGSLVRVEIEDNGPGMDEATRRRAFEPFFTTKPPGIGTGLGLSVSYFIITEDHGGTLSVESTSGGGTRFVIKLPAGENRVSPKQLPGCGPMEG
jgi:PAS domain S-box-containing protein